MTPDYREARAALDRANAKVEELTESGRRRRLAGKIWVVDDNPDVTESLVVLLATHNFDAEPVVGAASAVAKLRGGELPAVMILDLMMPNGGAPAVLAECDKPFPVILLTAAEDRVTSEQRARASRVFSKTIEPAELIGALHQLMWVPANDSGPHRFPPITPEESGA